MTIWLNKIVCAAILCTIALRVTAEPNPVKPDETKALSTPSKSDLAGWTPQRKIEFSAGCRDAQIIENIRILAGQSGRKPESFSAEQRIKVGQAVDALGICYCVTAKLARTYTFADYAGNEAQRAKEALTWIDKECKPQALTGNELSKNSPTKTSKTPAK